MKLLNRNIFAIMAATAGLLTSCSDDMVVRDNSGADTESGVVLYIPQLPEGVVPEESDTRAGTLKDFNASEGAIKTLRLFAYQDGAVEPVTFDMTSECEVIRNTGDSQYRTGYRLELENGNYRFYVVANTTFSNPETIKEEDLLKMTATVPADINASGLPMSCTHSDLSVKYDNGSYTPTQNATVAVNSGGSTRIRADLKFAVAKVRVTILNDMHPADQVNEFYVDGHSDASAIFSNGSYTPEAGAKFDVAGSYKAFPALPSDDLKNVVVDNLTDAPATQTSKWAWQTVFYVPEQLDQSQNATTVHMKIGDTVKALTVNHTDAVKGKIVERSHFYDYIGTSDGRFILDVQQWSPVAMIGALNGPTVLDIDKTGFVITAGEEVVINYTSNVPVTAECEKYGDDDIYDIRIDEEKGTITVSLSSLIDRTEFNVIKAGHTWEYFKLKAGPLVKKVEVKDIIFDEFINTDTDIVTVDVATRKESGDYSNNILVNLKTNLTTVKVEKIDWPAAAAAGNPASLQLLDKNLNVLADGAEVNPENGQLQLYVRFNDLNSSRELWQDNYDMKIRVSGVDYEGNAVISEIPVYVRSANDTYTIHLYAPGWSHPHIYVYQCLQLPADMTYTHGGKAGQIVGFTGDTAALEYDFTGAAAFMGWNVGQHNDPDDTGKEDNGFWIFTGNSAGGWNPGTANWTDHYYDLDFCAAHRQKLKDGNYCNECTKDNHDRGWPGIHMLPEGDDWWEFELSGVATPGKALIMFTDCNYNSHGEAGNRYPGNKEPGVALFDYPSKEGWFYYVAGKKNLGFTSYKPSSEPVKTYTYRIYWPYSSAWQGLNVWQGSTVWGNSPYETSNFNGGTNQSAQTGSFFGKYNDSYAYVQFSLQENPLSGNFNYQKITSGNDHDAAEPSVNANAFVLEDNIYHYTVTAVGAGQGGKPSGTPTPPNPGGPNDGDTTTTFEMGKTYAMIFSGPLQIWAWSDNGDAYSENKNNGDWDNQATYNGVYDFTPTKAGAKNITYKINKGSEITMSVSDFKYNSSSKRYEAPLKTN